MYTIRLSTGSSTVCSYGTTTGSRKCDSTECTPQHSGSPLSILTTKSDHFLPSCAFLHTLKTIHVPTSKTFYPHVTYFVLNYFIRKWTTTTSMFGRQPRSVRRIRCTRDCRNSKVVCTARSVALSTNLRYRFGDVSILFAVSAFAGRSAMVNSVFDVLPCVPFVAHQ